MSRTKTPLLICRRRRSWRILRGFGAILLILWVLGGKALVLGVLFGGV